ncbi:UDP-N-acetylenolpyruvoylglucosamine reductase [Pantoea rodasii]|uniref:UDP-N-acetylenolpyruvoylglucosamine reductase n=1 Tax=Pantoea rodasii TaxID=1076549 RepID=A0A2M9WHW7_9GAMM|nr:UDP-N-acetylmuramate dehydrogenase [Pantoea rodasii]ORM59402.1 UDP-N-acetylenolpyruvoylglucosamine reductase [Pantoea rodasii]PJZ07155.1 UDP-N-acetylenolpyruvoylglucosamine reductase [Pantoea rodasii]
MSSPNTSLKAFNTLGLEVSAQALYIADTPKAIINAWQATQQANQPFIVLGEGSNVLFLENFHGGVIINAIKGISLEEKAESWHLHIGAGENWHELVEHTLKKGITGLENLALIPGMAGSAPIQNIGAYGVEFKDICQYVEVLHLPTQELVRLHRDECQFGYRDSIFKHEMKENYVIIAVGLRLAKQWKPVLSYGDLAKLNPATVCAWDVFNAVCHMRKSKLPDPRETGNVGSFFKNPLITHELASTLLQKWPEMPHYPQENDQVKLAAGWLIDQCNLKGHQVGGAAVHRQQALVLINENQATPQDIVALAHEVRNHVGEKFNVWLEPEVRFIGAQGERNAVEVIS